VAGKLSTKAPNPPQISGTILEAAPNTSTWQEKTARFKKNFKTSGKSVTGKWFDSNPI